MIKNLWKITNVYCGNHEEPVLMDLKNGPKSVFYACPHYAQRYQGGKGCPNRINPKHFEEILEIISRKIQEDESNGVDINLTGYHFTHKGIECKVLKHTPESLDLQLLNKTVFIKKSTN